ncbi:ribonuclease III [Candidatus Peregrinibacteria bacterium CG11_big_fil_rev_8_21_14_0_20_46_8]|nr:MAG: ribonuclease III [Candidatus Peregrinibacteria bacterium CG11_big_fil_rev_8_21_14_0_20_46_8]
MRDLSELENKLQIHFTDHELLERACIHASYINEHRELKIGHNERLEFLGDAVLELVVTEYLYAHFPNKEEGELTALRAALVKGKHLADVARRLDLGAYLLLSKGEEKSGGREKNYLLANTLEALIGAIYLDKGFAIAHEVITRFILGSLQEIIEHDLHVDSKSKLQEITQEKFSITPSYQVLLEEGPDHDKLFEIGVFIGGDCLGKGKGTSKQKAEQEAARNALKRMGKLRVA